MQHLTVLTSKRNSLFDSKGRFHWTMNGVGLEFNHLFGFGVLGKFTLHILGSDQLYLSLSLKLSKNLNKEWIFPSLRCWSHGSFI